MQTMLTLWLACSPPPSQETVDHVIYLQALATSEPTVAALRCDDVGDEGLRGECRYFAAEESPSDEAALICEETSGGWGEACRRSLQRRADPPR